MTGRMSAPPPAFSSFKPARTARGRELQRAQDAARLQAQARYARVVKHEWAKKRVCQVLKLVRIDQWNGYIMPARDPAENKAPFHAKPSTAPERTQLIQLLRDVQHFEETGELPAYANETDEDNEEL